MEQANVLTDPDSDNAKRQQAADQLADLLGKAQAASFEPWIRELVQRDLAAVLSLAVALGKRAHGRTGDADVAMRTNHLAAQKTLLQCAGEKTDLSQGALGQRGGRHGGRVDRRGGAYLQRPSGLPDHGRKQTARRPGRVARRRRPTAAGRTALPATMRERVDVCLSKAVLVSDRYQDAVKLIVALAGRNPQAGVCLGRGVPQGLGLPPQPAECPKRSAGNTTCRPMRGSPSRRS